jgi:hypothetical protein
VVDLGAQVAHGAVALRIVDRADLRLKFRDRVLAAMDGMAVLGVERVVGAEVEQGAGVFFV